MNLPAVAEPGTCHASPPDARRAVAPCGAAIRPMWPQHVDQPSDSFCSSLRFIRCKPCRALVLAGQARQLPLVLG